MLCLPLAYLSAQTGIGTGGALPNSATAELEVASTDKGVLIPRMTDTEMKAIALPAEGLLVYNLTYSAFYYYSGGWKTAGFSYRTLIRDTDGDTRVEVENIPNENIVHFSANADNNGTPTGSADEVAVLSSTGLNLTSDNMTYQIEGTQVLRKKADPSGDNFFIGTGGANATGGMQNTSAGYGALDKTTTSNCNLAVGYNAGVNLLTGSGSVLVGHNVSSGPALAASGNAAVGASAAPVIQGSAVDNVVIGYGAGNTLTNGKHNILIGNNAGSNITSADSNIVIGINQTVPVATKKGQCNIGGVIGSDSIYNINGNVKFANAYTFPDKSSLADYTFVMGSGGNLGWGEKNVSGSANATVTGAATNMQPYSKLLGVEKGMSGDVYFVPVIVMANGQVAKLSTFIVQNNNVDTVRFGLFTFDGTNMNIVKVDGIPFTGGVSLLNVNNQTVTYDFYAARTKFKNVLVGETYYIGVYASSATNSASLLEKTDQDIKSKKTNVSSGRTGYKLLDTYSSFTGGELMWVRAH